MNHLVRIFFLIASCSSIYASTDLSLYQGKYVIIRNQSGKHPANSKCKKIGPKLVRFFSTYDSCASWKGENPPLTEVIAKCVKGPKIEAYIFSDLKLCEEALSDLNGGDAS